MVGGDLCPMTFPGFGPSKPYFSKLKVSSKGFSVFFEKEFSMLLAFSCIAEAAEEEQRVGAQAPTSFLVSASVVKGVYGQFG